MTSEPKEAEPPKELLSRKELWGWYAWECASAPFYSVIVTIFIPLLLLLLADGQAWDQLGNSAPERCEDAEDQNMPCIKCQVGKGDRLWHQEGSWTDLPSLHVYIGSLGLAPVAYANLIVGISVLLQVITFIVLGPCGDFSCVRKRGLLLATVVGSSSCIAMLAMFKYSYWWLAGLLVLVGNVALGMGSVFYNAYLSLLVDASPQVLAAREENALDKVLISRRDTLDKFSLTGISLGQFAAVAYTALAFLVALVPGIGNSLLLRLACFIGGIWWLVCAIPTALLLKTRPGPPFPTSFGVLDGWRITWRNLTQARNHKHTFRFLLVFFIYADGLNTMAQVAALFAQNELCMSSESLAGFAVETSLAAGLGSAFALYLEKRFHITSRTMLLVSLVAMTVIPLWTLLGYLTPPGSIGVKHEWEVFALGGLYGLTYGPIAAYSRSIFVEMIPLGKEAAFFSLYSIFSNGSSAVGPLIVAAITQATGGARSGAFYVLPCMVFGTLLLWRWVDIDEGIKDVNRLAKASASTGAIEVALEVVSEPVEKLR